MTLVSQLRQGKITVSKVLQKTETTRGRSMYTAINPAALCFKQLLSEFAIKFLSISVSVTTPNLQETPLFSLLKNIIQILLDSLIPVDKLKTFEKLDLQYSGTQLLGMLNSFSLVTFMISTQHNFFEAFIP